MLLNTASDGPLNMINIMKRHSSLPGLTARVLPLLGVPHHPDLRGGPSHVRPPQPDVVAVAEDDMEDEEGDSQDDGAHPDVFLLPRLSV